VQRLLINDGDALGVVYRPERPVGRCAVVLGGSGGGIPDRFTSRVASTGVLAFGVAYFGVAGLPDSLVGIRLERVVRAIKAFRRRFEVEGPLGLVGSSKGAELALCLASRVGELVGPVVVASPTSVSWYGLDGYGRPAMTRPSWSWDGVAVPFLPYRQGARPSFSPGTGLRVDGCYQQSGYPAEWVDAASLQVEKAAGPVLILAGENDHMWPSAAMATQLIERMRASGRANDVSAAFYPDAGHVFLHHDASRCAASGAVKIDFGGSAAGDAEACRDGWARIGAFLAA
jgi:pimeloyl-ACP methyl ester carboxylesterase